MLHTRGFALIALFASALASNSNSNSNDNPAEGSQSKPQLHRLKLQREKIPDSAQLAALQTETESGQVVFDPRFELEALANKYGGASKIGFGAQSPAFDKVEDEQRVLGDDGKVHSAPLQSKPVFFNTSVHF